MFGVLALVCFLAVSQASSVTYHWRGNDNDFDNKANWAGSLNPMTGKPSSVELSTEPSSSYVGTGTYSIGKEIDLGNSELVFPDTGLVVLEFDETATAGVAKFIGGENRTEANDFLCHKNWYTNTKANPISVTSPPCDGAIAAFDAGHSYAVFVSNEIQRVNLDGIMLENNLITSCSNLPSNEFDIPCSKLFFLNTTICSLLGQVGSDGKCLCHSSCPDANMAATQLDQVRDAVMNSATNVQDFLQSSATMAFSFIFTPASLSLTPSEVLNALVPNGVYDPVVMANIFSAINSTLYAKFGPDASVVLDPLSVTPEGNVVVTGVVVGTKGMFYTLDANGNPVQTFLSQVNVTSPSSVSSSSSIVKSIAAAISTEVLDNTANALQSSLSAASSTCVVCANSGILQLILNGFSYYSNPSALAAVLNSTTCTSASCLLTSLQGFSTTAAASGANIATFASGFTTQVTTLSAADRNEVNAFINSYASLLNQLASVNSRESNSIPVATSVTFPASVIGTRLVASDLPFYIDSQNKAKLAAALSANLEGYGQIVTADASTFAFSLSVDGNGKIVGVIVNFKYTMMCIPNTACSMSAAEQASAVAMMNHVIELYSLSYSACFTVNTGFDASCLQNQVTQAYKDAIAAGKSPAEAKAIAIQKYLSLYGCGPQGAYPDGSCVDPNAMTNANSTANTYASNAASSSSSAGSSGGSSLLIIAVAAAVAVLIVVAVIVIVATRRRKTRAAAAAPRRDPSIVAFENPMYDEGSRKGSATDANGQPLYDNGTVEKHNGGEGLYDEPANNPGGPLRGKANPVYASSEDLYDEAADQAEGGYLDVSAAKDEDFGFE